MNSSFKRKFVYNKNDEGDGRLKFGQTWGVEVGFKKVEGKVTDKLSIIVMVEKKLSEATLNKENIVDRGLDGIPTDVQQVGIIKAFAKGKNQRMKKWRPAPRGVSIGHYQIIAGTLGAAVTDKKTPIEVGAQAYEYLVFTKMVRLGYQDMPYARQVEIETFINPRSKSIVTVRGGVRMVSPSEKKRKKLRCLYETFFSDCSILDFHVLVLLTLPKYTCLFDPQKR